MFRVYSVHSVPNKNLTKLIVRTKRDKMGKTCLKMVWVEGGEMTFKKLIRMWTCKWGMVRFIDLRFWLWFLDNIEELFNLMAWTISNKLLYKLHTAICLSCDPQLNFFFFFYRVFIAGAIRLIYLQQPCIGPS
jgi:hypothetical protein